MAQMSRVEDYFALNVGERPRGGSPPTISPGVVRVEADGPSGAYSVPFTYTVGDPAAFRFLVEWRKDGKSVMGRAAPSGVFSPTAPVTRVLDASTNRVVEVSAVKVQSGTLSGTVPSAGTYVGVLIIEDDL